MEKNLYNINSLCDRLNNLGLINKTRLFSDCNFNTKEELLNILNNVINYNLRDDDLCEDLEIGEMHDLVDFWDLLTDDNKYQLVGWCFYRTWDDLDTYDNIEFIIEELKKEYGYKKLTELIEITRAKGIRFSPIGTYVYYKEDK